MRAVRFWVSSIVLPLEVWRLCHRPCRNREATTPDRRSLQSRCGRARTRRSACSRRLRELAADSAAAAAKDKVSATASAKDGFSIKSADGKFSLKFRGLVQTDARFFLSDSAVSPWSTTSSYGARRPDPRCGSRQVISSSGSKPGLRPGATVAVRRVTPT